jgi:hypothetical protein
MPSVFTDEAGTYDLTITTSADWTVSTGGLPNGDNYVTGDGTIALTYNVNGDDFDLRDGTAWTVECWLYYATATAVSQLLVGVQDKDSPFANAWYMLFGADEKIDFTIANTTPGIYLQCQSAALSTGTWYHVVGIKETGNVLKLYIDNTLVATDNTTSGTAQTPDADYYVTMGTGTDGGNDIGASSSGLRLAKVAIYNRELTAAEINDHYLAMVAT